MSTGPISNFTIPDNTTVLVKQCTIPEDSSRGKSCLISIKTEGNFAVISNKGTCQFIFGINDPSGRTKIGCEACQGAYPFIVSTTVTLCKQSDILYIRAFQNANVGTITVHDCYYTVILLQSW